MPDQRTDRRHQPNARPGAPTVVAGWAVVLLGAANVGFALVSFASDAVRLTSAAAVTLLVVGALTAGLGVFVHRGSRPALALALLVFGTLLIIELGNMALAGSGDTAPRVVVLAVVVLALAYAQLRGRPQRRRRR